MHMKGGQGDASRGPAAVGTEKQSSLQSLFLSKIHTIAY